MANIAAYTKSRGWRPTKKQELLLKAAIFQDPHAVSAWKEWLSITDIENDMLDYDSFRLLPLVYRNIANRLTDPVMEKLKGIYRSVWFKNQMKFRALQLVLGTFNDAGIKTMLLKGSAFILHYYQDHGLRLMDDVDVLVPLRDVEKAMALLEGMGWKMEKVAWSRPELIRRKHAIAFNCENRGQIDLHWHFDLCWLKEKDDDHFWAGAVPLDLHEHRSSILNPTDQLLHVCVHGARRRYEYHFDGILPVCLRWITDTMEVLSKNSNDIEWDSLLIQARRSHVRLQVYEAFTYLKREFNAPIPTQILKDLKRGRATWKETFHHITTMRLFSLPDLWILNGYFQSLCDDLAFRDADRWTGPELAKRFVRFLQKSYQLKYAWQVLPYVFIKSLGKLFSILRNSKEPALTSTGAFLEELEFYLRNDLLQVWFPKCIDKEHGGFLCDFDRKWKPAGPQRKRLGLQARQTRVAAMAAMFYPDDRQFWDAASHGFKYLKDVMWDAEFGGWYVMLDQNGIPNQRFADNKHAHETAYAVAACAVYYQLTQDPEALELAKKGFVWLETHAHDKAHGGYNSYFQRNGALIVSRDQVSCDHPDKDPIQTPFGLKDHNTNVDLLEALAELYRVWPDPLVRERLEELIRIARDKIIDPSGATHFYFHPDWTPVPELVNFAHTLQTTNFLSAAFQLLGQDRALWAKELLKSLVDHAIRYAWDNREGGFYYRGCAFGPIYDKRKPWWGQAEGLGALLTVATLYPIYFGKFQKQWRYIKTHIIDHKYKGWYEYGLDTAPEAKHMLKGSEYLKDARHEVLTLMHCIQMLRMGKPETVSDYQPRQAKTPIITAKCSTS